MYGLVIKGTKDLLHVSISNGCDEGEITHGPVCCLTQDQHEPLWLIGNYDLALAVTKPVSEYQKAWMHEYNTPYNQKKWELEVVEVHMLIK